MIDILDFVSIRQIIHDVLAHPDWRAAMVNEMKALVYNETWELVSLSINKELIGCKWVYTIKVNSDGSLSCLKAHLIAKEYVQ